MIQSLGLGRQSIPGTGFFKLETALPDNCRVILLGSAGELSFAPILTAGACAWGRTKRREEQCAGGARLMRLSSDSDRISMTAGGRWILE